MAAACEDLENILVGMQAPSQQPAVDVVAQWSTCRSIVKASDVGYVPVTPPKSVSLVEGSDGLYCNSDF